MANVPVPDALRDELRGMNLVVWEAKRDKKGEPVHLTLDGPGRTTRLFGTGPTIEDAATNALNNPWALQTQDSLRGALARLEEQVRRLNCELIVRRCFGDLDDDIPF